MSKDKKADKTPLVAGGLVLGSFPLQFADHAFNKKFDEINKDPDVFRFAFKDTLGESIDEDLHKVIVPKQKRIPVNYGIPETSSSLVTEFVKGDPKPQYHIELATNSYIPSRKKTKISVPTLAHELGHYKNKMERKWLQKLRKVIDKDRSGFLGNAAAGGAVYGAIKALGGSDESALAGSGIGSVGFGVLRSTPKLTEEALASIEGLRGINRYNRLIKNSVPMRKAIKQLGTAFGTYLSEAAQKSLIGGGLGLGTIYLAHRALKRLKDKRARNNK